MDKVWLLLLTAGLVVGVALIGGNYYGSAPVEREVSESPKVEESPGQSEIENQPLREKPEQDREEIESVNQEETSLSNGPETLDFKVDVNSEGENYETRFRIKHLGRKKEDIRIDTVREDGAKMTVILKGSSNEGWVSDYSSSSWTHFTGFAFTQWWRRRSDRYLVYKVGAWEEMEGEEFTVENEDGSGRVYNIDVNTEIPDSVFTPN